MNKITHLSHILFGILFLASLFFLGSFGFKPELNSRANSSYGSGNMMCAPLNRIHADPFCALEPIAPTIEIDWQNQMNISASEEAKQMFNQGLFFLYGFNHAEAERSFKEGIRLDDNCAMCYWGASLALGPNINVPMPPSQVEDAFKYSRIALEMSASVTPKEQALIAALQLRYQQEAIEDRTALDRAFAEEMKYVANRYREDLDIATIYAEALMDLMPWDYWEEDDSPKPMTREIQALLDYVLEKDPRHPGANHYYIHLAEAVHPQLAVPSADRLNQLDYPSGHLIHMPSHVYIRVGRFQDAFDMNVRSIAADEEYIAACNVQGLYPAIYYPHNIHFLWFVAMMEGKSNDAILSARKLEKKVPFAMMAAVPMIELFKPIEILTLVRFGKWDEILQTPRPDATFKYSNNMWRYAWGLAYAKKGQLENAREQLAALKKGLQDPELRAVDDPQFPTILSSEIAIHLLEAEIEGLQGNANAKLMQITEAIASENQLIYMEPPLFYYQVKLSLGDALLTNGQAEKAEKAFREALSEFPANGWALKGLHSSLVSQGKIDQARKVKTEYEAAWSNADVKIERAVF